MDYEIINATENDRNEIMTLYQMQLGREFCFWDKSLSPSCELARLAVHPDLHNHGLGKILMQFGMDELKNQGFRGIHFLVNKDNRKAIRCYQNFGFHIAGECYLYDQDFLCYEKAYEKAL